MNTNIIVTAMRINEWQRSLVAVKNAYMFAGTYDLVKMAESLSCGLKPRERGNMQPYTVAYHVRVEMIFPSMHIKKMMRPRNIEVNGRSLTVATKTPFRVSSNRAMTGWEGPFIEKGYKSYPCRVTPVFPNDPTTIMDRELICYFEGIFPSNMSEEDILESIRFEDGDI